MYRRIIYSVFFLFFIFFLTPTVSHAQVIQIAGDCDLYVPANPLSAQGLATPYQLASTHPDTDGPCRETERFETTMVEAAVFDPATSQISVYYPLVVDYGMQPALPPVVPQLPPGAIVAIWGGTNTNNITLRDVHGSLRAGNCVNGIPGSIFGQNWYCNAPAFFAAAKKAITAGTLQVPPPGKALDGMPCPTVGDFYIGDMDPHDNVTTLELGLYNNGAVAQFTTANEQILTNAMVLTNGSDQKTVTGIQQALGCQPFKAPNLADPGVMSTALPLNELQDIVYPPTPHAVVGAADPFTFDNNGNPSLAKVNAYRAMVGQDPVSSLNQTELTAKYYCQNMRKIQASRMLLDKQYLVPRTTPDPSVANNLFTFYANRFVGSYGADGLNCEKVLNLVDPITLVMDKNGITVDAIINPNDNRPFNKNGGNNTGGNTGGNNQQTGGNNQQNGGYPQPTHHYYQNNQQNNQQNNGNQNLNGASQTFIQNAITIFIQLINSLLHR